MNSATNKIVKGGVCASTGFTIACQTFHSSVGINGAPLYSLIKYSEFDKSEEIEIGNMENLLLLTEVLSEYVEKINESKSMKTVIFSGPNCSGKTTRARMLQTKISKNKSDHYAVLSSDINEITQSVIKGKYKTVLLDTGSPEAIVKLALSLSQNNFDGTFIAVTLSKNVNLQELYGKLSVHVYYLTRFVYGD